MPRDRTHDRTVSGYRAVSARMADAIELREESNATVERALSTPLKS
jgi:hypothetical protein